MPFAYLTPIRAGEWRIKTIRASLPSLLKQHRKSYEMVVEIRSGRKPGETITTSHDAWTRIVPKDEIEQLGGYVWKPNDDEGTVSKKTNAGGWNVLFEKSDVEKIIGRTVTPKDAEFRTTFVDGRLTHVQTNIIVLSKAEHRLLVSASYDFNERYELNPNGVDVRARGTRAKR